jgi:hypothetical protein
MRRRLCLGKSVLPLPSSPPNKMRPLLQASHALPFPLFLCPFLWSGAHRPRHALCAWRNRQVVGGGWAAAHALQRRAALPHLLLHAMVRNQTL